MKYFSQDYWFGKDKLMHFLACFLATVIVDPQTALIGGTAKEVVDIFGSGFSYKDLAWDCLGVGCGLLIKAIL